MPKFWQTDAFKQLSHEWYQRLADSGFEDVEREEYLKQTASHVYFYRKNCSLYRRLAEKREKELYYELLEQQIEFNPPRSRIERLVMYYAALGYNKCAIARELDGLRHRKTIRFIIRKYENAWNIRRWKKEKLDPNWKTAHTR